MPDKSSRIIIPWLLLFVYFPFAYNYGVKSTGATMAFSDLPSFYGAAQLTFNEHRSPYDMEALQDFGKTIDRRVNPYLYPPPSLLAFYPFASISYSTAKVALTVVNQVCVVALLYVLLVQILNYRVSEILGQLGPAALVIYVLLSRGITFTIEEGQINLVVILLLCLVWCGLSRNGPAWLVGLALGSAILLKTYPVVMIPLLLLRRRYAACIWMASLLVVATALAAIVLPHSAWSDWYRNVASTAGYARTPYGLFLPSHRANQSINGFVSRLFLENSAGPRLHPHMVAAQLIGYLAAMGIFGVTFYACYFSSRNDSGTMAAGLRNDSRMTSAAARGLRAIDIEFSLFLIISFLVAPLSWEHHLAFVAPACVVALVLLMRMTGIEGRSEDAVSAGMQLIVLLSIFMIAWPFKPSAIPMPYVMGVVAASAKFYAVIVLWLFLLRAGRVR